MDLSLIDHLIVVAYALGLLFIGWQFSRSKQSDENYLLAARKLSLPAFLMTLVTTWYGLILGVGEFVFGSGVVAWITNGLFWYAVYIFFALFLAKKIHETKKLTIADQLREKAGEKSGTIAAIMTYIMTTPAPYILSLGVLVNVLFGISLFWAMVFGAIISALYVWSGGFRAVVKTDMIQFVLMYIGFGALLFFSMQTFGGFQYLSFNLPPAHLTWHGDLGLGLIIVWGLLAFWTLVDPNFYQRCYAAKDAKTAQKGILWATVLGFVFDMMTLATGLYAKAAFPESNALFSYLTLADGVLPIVMKGVFVATLFSIIMSTIDSFLFSSSTIVANDFLKKNNQSTSLTALTRRGIVITLALSFLLIFLFDSIIGIVYAVGTVGVATLLFPILLALFAKRNLNDMTVATSMILAGLASGAWLVHGWLNQAYGWPTYLYTIEPMYVGLVVSGLVLLLGSRKVFRS